MTLGVFCCQLFVNKLLLFLELKVTKNWNQILFLNIFTPSIQTIIIKVDGLSERNSLKINKIQSLLFSPTAHSTQLTAHFNFNEEQLFQVDNN